MPKYMAFLRAINVGGRTVKMDVLRGLFESMGFARVETFIASGNVIFEAATSDTPALERMIEESLQAALGYEVATFVRSTAEVAAMARSWPFDPAELDAEGNTLYIAFIKDRPDEEVQQKLLSFTTTVDEFHVGEREIYWLCRKTVSRSDFSGALLEKTLGMAATIRNVSTIKRLVSKYT